MMGVRETSPLPARFRAEYIQGRSLRAALAVEALPFFEAEAAERQAEARRQQGEHGKEGGRGHAKPSSQKVDSRVSDRNEGKAEAAERLAAGQKEGGRGHKKNSTQQVGESLDRHEGEAEALPFFEAEAAERQKAAGRQQASRGAEGGRGNKKPLTQKVGEGVSDRHDREAEAQAAQHAGTNREYVHMAKKLKEEDPDRFDRIRQGEETLAKVKAERLKEVRRGKSKSKNKKPPRRVVPPVIRGGDERAKRVSEQCGGYKYHHITSRIASAS